MPPSSAAPTCPTSSLGRRVGLVVDNPKRDLLGAVLVTHELLKLDVEPYIVPMYEQGYDVPLIAPDVVLVNYARLTNRELLRGYKALGAEVVVMDTEGGVLSESGSDSPENWARLFKRWSLDECVDRYLFWGPRLRAAFAAARTLPEHKLEVTGCPRYDFCHPRWNALLDHAMHGFVLVNTNFSAVNPRFTSSAQAELRVFTDTGWDKEYTVRLFEDLQAVFPRYLEAIAGMARRNPSRTIVVRPHPFEDDQLYKQRFGDLPNIVVDPAGNVLNAIKAADCIVHLNCGTAVESLLLGKTPISLEFLNTSRMLAHARLPSEISCHALDERDLDLLISDESQRSARWQPQPLLERYVRGWFHVIDGEASKRVAGAIAHSPRAGKRRTAQSLNQSVRGGLLAPSKGQIMQGIASNLLGTRAVSALRTWATPARRAKRICAKEIEELLLKMARAEGRDTRVRVASARHPLTSVPLSSLRVAYI